MESRRQDKHAIALQSLTASNHSLGHRLASGGSTKKEVPACFRVVSARREALPNPYHRTHFLGFAKCLDSRCQNKRSRPEQWRGKY